MGREPDQIDMMSEQELRQELRTAFEWRYKLKKSLHITVSGITQSMHSHIDGNDLIFRDDVYKVIKEI